MQSSDATPLSRRRLAAWLVALSALSATAAVRAAFADADFLQASGPVIRREHGHGAIVTLRGTNLGGWFLQEPWMCPIGTGRVLRAGWRAEVNGAAKPALLDGDGHTSATIDSGAVTIAFGRWQAFDGVVLRTSAPPGQPRDWSLSVLGKNGAWRDAAVDRLDEAAGELTLTLAGGLTAQALRIRRVGPGPWPLAEVNLTQADDYTIRSTLLARFGATKADELLRVYQSHWITERDFDEVRDWGMNVVRVPLNWLDFLSEAGEWKPRAWERLDWLLRACDQRNIYVILDLHGVPGGASPWASSGRAGDDGTGQNPNGFWTDPRCLALTEKLWAGIAARYRHRAVVAGYDLVNEPVRQFDEVVGEPGKFSAAILAKTAILDRLYRAVRRADPEHMIFMAAFTTLPPEAKGRTEFDGITPPQTHGWTNVVYQTHHYDMANANDHDAQQRLVEHALREIVAHQQKWNVPLYAGEFSLYHFDDVWRKWLSGLNAAHISWTNWTYKVRKGATEPGGGNWGYFNSYLGPTPDVAHDTADEIAHAWAQPVTSRFARNDHLIQLVREFTRHSSAPAAGSSRR